METKVVTMDLWLFKFEIHIKCIVVVFCNHGKKKEGIFL